MHDSDGNLLHSNFVVGNAALVASDQVEIVSLADDRLVVSWTDDLGQIQARILGPTGDSISPVLDLEQIQIGTDFSLAATAENGFVVVWQNDDLTDSVLLGAVYNQDGSLIVGPTELASDVSLTGSNPTVTVLNDGSFVVNYNTLLTGQDIVGQRFNSSLEVAGETFLLNTTTAGNEVDASVAILDNGQLVVSYNSGSSLITQQAVMAVTGVAETQVNLGLVTGITPTISDDAAAVQGEVQTNVFVRNLTAGARIFVGAEEIFPTGPDNLYTLTGKDPTQVLIEAPVGFSGPVTGTLVTKAFHDFDDSETLTNFRVNFDGTAPVPSASGVIALDEKIDGSISNDDRLSNVNVSLYIESQTQLRDFTFVETVSTKVNGRYTFSNLEEGREYIVVVESTSIALAGETADSAWAQQTYASAGSIDSDFFADEIGDNSFTDSAGYRIGGAESETSDLYDADAQNYLQAQHVNYFTATAGDAALTNIDFGFNFNVVNHVGDSNVALQSDAQISQGSFRQFLINAAALEGENQMVFIPTVPADQTAGEDWWRLDVMSLLPEITDDFTIIDGRAWQAPASGSGDRVRLDLNPGTIDALFTGDVGVDAAKTGGTQASVTGIEAPDLEIVNASGEELNSGLQLVADADNVNLEGVAIRNIAINGFGTDTAFRTANIIVIGDGETDGIDHNVSGFELTGSVIGARPDGSSTTNGGNNVFVNSAEGSGPLEGQQNRISNNFIANAGAAGVTVLADDTNQTMFWTIDNNIIANNGVLGENNGDGLDIRTGDPENSNFKLTGNLITGNGALGVDTFRSLGGIDIESNTITNNGFLSEEEGGIRLFGVDNTVIGNAISDNAGPGVNVTSAVTLGMFNTRAASTNNIISTNEFDNNDGVAIDLTESSPVFANDNRGDGVTDIEGRDSDKGNEGFDSPEIRSVDYLTDQLVLEFDDDRALTDVNGDGILNPDELKSIEIYLASPGAEDRFDGRNYGEGSAFLASINPADLVKVGGRWQITVDRSSFDWPTFVDGDAITAIAIDPDNNTSEFGRNRRINFAPVAGAATLEVTEDQTKVFAPSTFSFSDENAADTQFEFVRIDSLPTGDLGTLLWSGTSGDFNPAVEGLTFSFQDIEDGKLKFEPAADKFGSETFTYSLSDGSVFGLPGTASIVVAPVNDAPTTSTVTLAPIGEDSNARLITQAELLANASDVDGDALTATDLKFSTGGGTLVDNMDGTWSYTPAANDDTAVSFSYDVKDAMSSVSGLATLDITPANDAPTTSPVTLTPIAENSGVRTITQAELLENANDIDGDTLTASALSITSGRGLVVDNGDGTFSFTPDENDDSSVTFTYQVGDGSGNVSGSATLNFTSVNDAPTTTPVTLVPIAEDSGVRVITQAELLGNASDIEDDPLTATGLATTAGNGSLVDNGDGTWNYTPAADDDTDVSFSYTITDGTDTVAGSATLDITPIDDAPTTSEVTLTPIAEDSGVRLITQSELLEKANDIEGDPITATFLNIDIGSGTIVDNGDGTWNFTPALDDDTSVVFSYRVGSPDNNVAGSATLDITPVNDAPTSAPVALTPIAEDSGVRTITQAELLANASDIEGDTLTANGLAITNGNGLLVDNGDGTWNYTPDADDDTDVTFSYTVTDATDTVAGSATLDITPVNDAPTTTPVRLSQIFEDSGVRVITQEELLKNAGDVDGDALTATGLAISAGEGTLDDNGDGTWDYTPAADDGTNASFSYIVTDGTDDVAGSATLEIRRVNDAPTTSPVALAPVAEDSGVRVITQSELLTNADDVEDDSLTATGLTISSGNGTLDDNGDGTWNYTPAADDDSNVSFSYTVTDGTDSVAGSATLDITPVNDAPTTTPVTLSQISEDSGVRVITQEELLENARDVDGDALTAAGLAISAGNGTLDDNGDGTWNYTPAADDDSNVSFSYTVIDGTDSVAGSATLDITPVNDAPTATPVALAPVAEDSGVRVITQSELLANANDVEDDSLTATGLTISSGNGTLDDNGDGTWNYTPAADDDSNVSFSYTVTDGTDSVAGSATLDITPVNDAPTATPVALTPIAENSGVRVITQADLLANASDLDGDQLTATGLTNSAGNGTLVDNGDGTWDYTPAANDDTDVSFSYTITDAMENIAATATLDITPFNDDPTTSEVTLVAIAEDSGVRVITQAQLLANASDIEGDTLTAADLAISDGNGSLVNNGDGTWNYTPANNDDTDVSFSYSVTDGTNTVAGSAKLDITPVNDEPTTTEVTLTAIAEDSGVRVITQDDLLANGSDIEGDTLTATGLAISDGNGSLVDNGDGTWNYTPADDDDTDVSFSYTISDGANTVAGSAKLDITSVNDAPTATPVTLTPIAEDSGVRVITQEDLLANANDIDGDALTAADLAISNGNGSLVDNGDGTWDYTSAADDDTNVRFSYSVTDGTDTVAASATLDIIPVNDAPEFTNVISTVNTVESSRLVTRLTATDTEGDQIRYTLTNAADNQFFTLNTITGELQFKETPTITLLGQRSSALVVEVEVADSLAVVTRSIVVNTPDFAVPVPSPTTDDSNSPADQPVNNDGGVDPTDVGNLVQTNQDSDDSSSSRQTPTLFRNDPNSGVDDRAFEGESLTVVSDKLVDLVLYESYYQVNAATLKTELVSQQLADVYKSRRVNDVDATATELATLFWEDLDSSNEEYLQKNLKVDQSTIIAVSGGVLSFSLFGLLYGGSVAFTTLATQLPAWKSLDITPLISAFDEDEEETIHQIVDG